MNSNKPVALRKVTGLISNSRRSVIENTQNTFPDSNWNDPSWGVLDNEKAVIEFNISGKEDMDNAFMLNVRGGQIPTGEIAKLWKHHDWVALGYFR